MKALQLDWLTGDSWKIDKLENSFQKRLTGIGLQGRVYVGDLRPR